MFVQWWMILVPALLVTDVAMFWLGYQYCRRRLARQRADLPSRETIEAELGSLNSVIEELGTCLGTIEKSLAAHTRLSLDAAAPTVEREDEGSERYRIAGRLARRGARVDSLMSDCGLSRGEAELIANLQGGQGPQQ